MTVSDEIVRVEEFKIERFMALGLGRYEAIRAVEDAIDWHAVEALLKTAVRSRSRSKSHAESPRAAP